MYAPPTAIVIPILTDTVRATSVCLPANTFAMGYTA